MEFSANNPVVKLCMQGMRLEDAGNYEDALALFLQAWEEATGDAEKFTSAYHIARRQTKPENRLKWFKGEERVYIVEPTGDFENDPNVTNKKFAGNPTRSYRSQKPLKVIGEIKNWARITLEERSKWQERLANNDGEIIN